MQYFKVLLGHMIPVLNHYLLQICKDERALGNQKEFMVTLDRYSTNNYNITMKGKSNYCHMTSVTLEAPPTVWDTA